MSGEHSRSGILDQNEGLEVIREELDEPKTPTVAETEENEETGPRPCDATCVCLEKHKIHLKNKLDPEAVEKLLKQKEQELTTAFEQRLQKETYLLKDRCDYILL